MANFNFAELIEKMKELPEKDNTEKALKYAGEHKDDTAVRKILKEVGDEKLLEGCGSTIDYRRFRGLNHILMALLDKEAATENNLNALFGDINYLKRTLFDLTGKVKPPYPRPDFPAGSPLDNMYSSYLKDGANKRNVRRCDHCNISEGEEGCKGIFTCTGCRIARYCSRDCQIKGWKLHKPDCLGKQGKTVDSKAKKQAERIRNQMQDVRMQEFEAQIQEAEEQAIADVRSFEPRIAWDCEGVPRESSLPWNGDVYIEVVARKYGLTCMRMGYGFLEKKARSDGIPLDGRKAEIKNESTGKKLHIYYTRLFENQGTGSICGIVIEGICDDNDQKVSGPTKSFEALFSALKNDTL